MKIAHHISTVTGKSVQTGLKLVSSTGVSGQALPGLVVERTNKNYLKHALSSIPGGVIVITGTNGKTTTTKIITELLSKQGLRVLTNKTGSNMGRGLISGILRHTSWLGKLNYDIAVFEVDEAHARLITKIIKPRWVLALNVSRDQLDRFGEVDTVAQLIAEVMGQATEGVVTNASDPYMLPLAQELKQPANIVYFGLDKHLKDKFRSEDALASISNDKIAKSSNVKPFSELKFFAGDRVSFLIKGEPYQTSLAINGQHNYLNALAALTLVMQLLPDVGIPKLLVDLSNIKAAFGRGEVFTLKDGSKVQLILTKNPASFMQSFMSYDIGKSAIMIAINDGIADSRDVSWLWDVDFSGLPSKIHVTSGTRAADMALRLSYDDKKVAVIEEDLNLALKTLSKQEGDKIIFATYTAMLKLHTLLKKTAGKSL